MVRLVMKADGVTEAHLRHALLWAQDSPDPSSNVPASKATTQRTRENASIQDAEDEGMPSQPETLPPSRTDLVAGQT